MKTSPAIFLTLLLAALAGCTSPFSFTPMTGLGERPHSADATEHSASGNSSDHSNSTSFAVDRSAPDPPVLFNPADGSLTPDATPVFTGTAEAGSSVEIFVARVAVGRSTAGKTGMFTVTPMRPLAEGDDRAHAVATDLAGNPSPASPENAFTIDTLAPAAPLPVTPAHGSIVSPTPHFAGTAEPRSRVEVFVDGVTFGTTMADADGYYAFTSKTAQTDGPHTASVVTTDATGNNSARSASNGFDVDSAASPAPVLTGPADRTWSRDPTPEFSGSTDPGNEVEVYVDNATIGTTRSDALGDFHLSPKARLSESSHVAFVIATNSVGDVSPQSNTNALTIDTTDPEAPVLAKPINGSAADPTPDLVGTTEPNAFVEIFLDGVSVGAPTADGDGAFTFTPTTPLIDGPHTAVAVATDTSGNVSDPSTTTGFTVDLPAPSAPVVVKPADSSRTLWRLGLDILLLVTGSAVLSAGRSRHRS